MAALLERLQGAMGFRFSGEPTAKWKNAQRILKGEVTAGDRRRYKDAEIERMKTQFFGETNPASFENMGKRKLFRQAVGALESSDKENLNRMVIEKELERMEEAGLLCRLPREGTITVLSHVPQTRGEGHSPLLR